MSLWSAGRIDRERNPTQSGILSRILKLSLKLNIERLGKLVDIQNSDNNKKVSHWINEFISFLEEQIEHAKIREEIILTHWQHILEQHGRHQEYNFEE